VFQSDFLIFRNLIAVELIRPDSRKASAFTSPNDSWNPNNLNSKATIDPSAATRPRGGDVADRKGSVLWHSEDWTRLAVRSRIVSFQRSRHYASHFRTDAEAVVDGQLLTSILRGSGCVQGRSFRVGHPRPQPRRDWLWRERQLNPEIESQSGEEGFKSITSRCFGQPNSTGWPNQAQPLLHPSFV